MPAIANIVISDGAGSPVSHTFTPIGRDNNGVFWFEQTTPAPANPLAAKRIGYKQTRGVVNDAKKNLSVGVTTVTYTLSVPTMETLDAGSTGFLPPPTIAYREIGRVSFDLSERSVTQERKDTRVLLANLLAAAMPVANIDTLQPSY